MKIGRIGLYGWGLLAALSALPEFVEASQFGSCASGNALRAATRNDSRMGAWYNPERPGHGFDFLGSSNDGVIIDPVEDGAAFVWYTFDGAGNPVWLSGNVNYPLPTASTWSTEILYSRRMNGQVNSDLKAGTITFTFKPGGDPKRTEVQWTLYGNNSASSVANRISITNQANDVTQTECLFAPESSTLNGDPYAGVAPTQAYSGHWTPPSLPEVGFQFSFLRFATDSPTDSDGRIDKDFEIENTPIVLFDVYGNPRWVTSGRQYESAVVAKTMQITNPVVRVTNGYAAWALAPGGFQPATASVGSMTRRFETISLGYASLQLSGTFNDGFGLSYNLPESIITRLTTGRFDIGEPAAPKPPVFDATVNDGSAVTASATVGLTAGTFRVDESGSASYQIPVLTVPASGGLTPSVSMSYASAGGMGALGYGWNLTGLSAVARCRKSAETDPGQIAYPPVKFSAADAFCLDGQRLIQVATGSDASGSFIEYRTEIESFQRIRQYTATPDWWGVWGKDGSYREYGRERGLTQNARLSRSSASTDAAMSWALSRVEDASKNHYVYFYGYDATVAEQYINAIRYGGSNAYPISTALQPHQGEIRFAYQARIAVYPERMAYINGSKTQRSRYIKEISSWIGSKQLRAYKLDFGQVNDEWPDFRRLKAIKECSDSSGTVCYAGELRFEYSTDALDVDLSDPTAYTTFTTAGTTDLKFRDISVHKLGDVDGDGRQDLVWLADTDNNEEIYLELSRPDAGGKLHFVRTGAAIQQARRYDNDRGWFLFDYDANGTDDLIMTEENPSSTCPPIVSGQVPVRSEWRVRLGSAAGFGPSTAMTDAAGAPICSRPDAEAQIADIDGNGLADLIATGPNETLEIRYLQETGIAGSPYRYSTARGIALQQVNGTGMTSTIDASKINGDNFDVIDANGDGRADIVIRGTKVTGLNMQAAPAGISVVADADPTDELVGATRSPDTGNQIAAGTPRYWMILTAEGTGVSGTTETFKLYGEWLVGSNDSVVSDKSEAHFRVIDINTDGLADVLYEKGASGAWAFQLNKGVEGVGAFTPAYCVNDTNSPCPAIDNSHRMQVMDFNGDGQIDILELDGGAGSPNCLGREDCYISYIWNGYKFERRSALNYIVKPSGSVNDWVSVIADFNGDGNSEYLTYRPGQGEEAYGDWHLHRSKNRYQPRNLLTRITNNYGAVTEISYAPMTFSSVYRRDYNAPYLNLGRGAVVFDTVGPNYVVSSVKSSAPTETNQAAMAEIRYRYFGSKVQAGGRGSLGFRMLETFDAQRQVRTITSFNQAFPLTGRPEQSQTERLASVPSNTCSNPDTATCFVAAAHWWAVGPDDYLPLMQEPGSKILSSSEDLWESRGATNISTTSWKATWSTQAYGPSNPMPSVPVVHWVRPAISEKFSFDLNSNQQVGYEAEKFLSYDDVGNVLTTRSTKGKEYDAELIRIDTTNEYLEDALSSTNYRLGRLTKSTVTTTRNRRTDTGVATNTVSGTRISAWSYHPTTGLMNGEIRQFGGTRDQALITAYQRDGFGNIIRTTTCDNSVGGSTAAAMIDACNAVTVSNIAAKPTDDLTIRRYARQQYDTYGRFVDDTFSLYQPVNGASASERQDSQVVPTGVGTARHRNAYGMPLLVSDLYGKRARVLTNVMGLTIDESTEAGAHVQTSMNWCTGVNGGTAKCPVGAKVEVRKYDWASGTSTQYLDVLGRPMLSVKPGFAANTFIAVRTHYDVLGRTAKVSEPYFAAGLSGANDPSAAQGTVYWTQTSFDILDRPTYITHPNYSGTTMSYDGLATTTIDANQQRRTVLKDATGNIIRSTDHSNQSVCYWYDTYSNLTEIGRSTTASCGYPFATVLSTMTYDTVGRKISMWDRDMGGAEAAPVSWTYTYNAAGELLKQVTPRGQCTAHRYDVRGRVHYRADYTDSSCSTLDNAATFSFDVDGSRVAYGQLMREVLSGPSIPSSAFLRTHHYDGFGRASGTYTNIDGTTYGNITTYDHFGRVYQETDSTSQTTLNEYTASGYLKRIRDARPGREAHQYFYNNGVVTEGPISYSGSWGEVYYEVMQMNARGQVTEEWRGVRVDIDQAETTVGSPIPETALAGLGTHYDYDLSMGWVTGIRSGDGYYDGFGQATTGSHLQNWVLERDAVGNVKERSELNLGLRETFSYDAMNRLDFVRRFINNVETNSEDYVVDGWGNLTQRAGLPGTINYGAKGSCAVTPGPHAVSSANGVNYCYDRNGNQISASNGRTIQYSIADQAIDIRSTQTNASAKFFYGTSRGRYKRIDYDNASANANSNTRKTLYVGNVEIILDNSNNVIEKKRYIGGALVITMKQNGEGSHDYLLKDHLGSTDVIADRYGNIKQRESFDAFGLRRNPTNSNQSVLGVNYSPWSPYQLAGLASQNTANNDRTTRGYTGHEHVDKLGLIHMNGRIYDPYLGRFIQADPIVQDPFDTQSLNRYAYVFNNPLTNIDPSGNITLRQAVQIAAVVVISVYTAGTASGAAWGLLGTSVGPGTAAIVTAVGGAAAGAVTGGSKGALQGAFTGLVFFGIGQWSNALEKAGNAAFAADGIGRAFLHGVAGGALAELQGGSFGHGFVSAGLSKAITPTVVGSVDSPFAQGALVGLVGGTISHLTGGDFANGGATAAMAFAFNHYFSTSHMRAEGGGSTENRVPVKTSAAKKTNPTHVTKFFDDLHGPISEMATGLAVDENFLLGLSSYESGWYNDHNRNLNNPFGLTKGGGNNLSFDSPQDAIELWIRTFGDQVRGATTAEDFVKRLLDGPRVYNTVNKSWGDKVLQQIDTIRVRKDIWLQEKKQ